MAIQLFRKVAGLFTLRGRVAIYHARKNRLAKFVVTKTITVIWDIEN